MDFREKLRLLQKDDGIFEELALELFYFQSRHNPVYSEYLQRIGKSGLAPESLSEIPFLPISFFKNHKVFTEGYVSEICFRSSGTGGERSMHFLPDASFAAGHSRMEFIHSVGSIKDREIIALLPGYEENPDSSLIFMVKELEPESAGNLLFAGMDFETMKLALKECRQRGNKPLIFGVSHALLSLLETGDVPDFSDILLVETGGMKGLRKEISKAELLETLQQGFRPQRLVSEFGMCELSSQAYAFPEKYFPGFAMKVLVRQPDDPLGSASNSGRGVLNFIDLANFASCAFIAGEDLGEVDEDGGFKVFGRLDQAEIRGCNLLFAQN